MLKNKLLDNLFKEWVDINPLYSGNFVADGIINEEYYNKAFKKILFIAKEPNDPDQKESWDFRKLWNQEFKYPFTYRIAEWAHGILNDFPEFDELWKDRNRLILSLQSIAFMNVKKIGGRGSSERNEIRKHVETEKDFILKQISIIKPDLIILSLSFWHEIRNMIFGTINWKGSGYAIEIADWNGIILIDFYHPSRSIPPASYSLLQNVIKSNDL